MAFRRIQAEALRNNGDVGFSVNGVARADRFAFHADEERHRQTEDQRAEEVTEFLHDQRPAGLHDHFNIRTDIERDLRDQQKNAHGKHLARAIHFFEPHDAPARKAHQCTEYKCIKQRQKHDQTELLYTHQFREHHNNECCRVNFEVPDEIHERLQKPSAG